MTRYRPLALLCPNFLARSLAVPASSHTGSRSWLHRSVVACLVAITLAGFAPIGQAALAAPGDSGIVNGSTLAAGAYEADIDAFWQQRLTGSYWAPVVIPMADAVNSGCGYVEPHQYLAFYCTVDAAVYWSVSEYEQAVALSGDAAWVNVMAHEWSHHVQMLLGLNTTWRQNNDSVGLELEATCMGGAYIADARDRGMVDDAMIASMVGMFGGSEMHGTTEQVRSAFRNGIDGGLSACGIFL